VLAEGLDRETVGRFRFSVVAVDLGQPVRRSGSLLVELVVLDANDHAPTFDRLSYSALVAEITFLHVAPFCSAVACQLCFISCSPDPGLFSRCINSATR